MFRFPLPPALLLLCGLAFSPALAEIQRPFDERATARLVAEAIAATDPGLHVIIGSRGDYLSANRPGAPGHYFRLDRIHAQLRAEPDGARRQKLLDAYVAGELAVMRGVDQGTVKPGLEAVQEFRPDSLLPILRPPDPNASWDLPSLIHLGFPGGLFVFWTQDRTVDLAGTRMTPGPLTAHEARARHLDKLALQRLGIANLESRLDRVTTRREGRFLILSLDGRFGASLMLVPRLWQGMTRKGQVLTAALPHEDELIVIADASTEDLAALRQRVQAPANPAPLSSDLFRWTGSDWQVLLP